LAEVGECHAFIQHIQMIQRYSCQEGFGAGMLVLLCFSYDHEPSMTVKSSSNSAKACATPVNQEDIEIWVLQNTRFSNLFGNTYVFIKYSRLQNVIVKRRTLIYRKPLVILARNVK